MKIRRALFLSFVVVLSFAMNLKVHAGLEDGLDEDKIEAKLTKDISIGKEALLVLESLVAGGVVNGALNLVRKTDKSWQELLGTSVFVGVPQYFIYFLTRFLVNKILSKVNKEGQNSEILPESLAVIASYFGTILFYHYAFYQKDSSIKDVFKDCSPIIVSSFIFYLLFKYIKIYSKERRESMMA
jgi:hypothetical protein